jgi:hypothetical protein
LIAAEIEQPAGDRERDDGEEACERRRDPRERRGGGGGGDRLRRRMGEWRRRELRRDLHEDPW